MFRAEGWRKPHEEESLRSPKANEERQGEVIRERERDRGLKLKTEEEQGQRNKVKQNESEIISTATQQIRKTGEESG